MYLMKLDRSQMGEILVKFEDQRSIFEKAFGFLFVSLIFPALSLGVIFLGQGFQKHYLDWNFLAYFGFVLFCISIYLFLATLLQMILPFSILINLHEQWLTVRYKSLQIFGEKIPFQNLNIFKYSKKYVNIYQLEIELKNTQSIKFKSVFLSKDSVERGCLELNQSLGLANGESAKIENSKSKLSSFLSDIESQYEQKSLSLPIRFELGLESLRKVANGLIAITGLYFMFNVYQLLVHFSLISFVHSLIVFIVFYKIFSELSKQIKVEVDDKVVSCQCRYFLKTVSWTEPLVNYSGMILDDASDNKRTKFIQIILVHKNDKEKNVPLSKNIRAKLEVEVQKKALYEKLLRFS